MLPGEGNESLVDGGGHEVVATVGEQAVDREARGDGDEVGERVSGDADVAGLALALQLAHGGQGFVDDLVGGTELGVVDLQEIDVVGLEAAEGVLDTLGDGGGGEVELVDTVAAALGGEDHAVAMAGEAFAQARFGEREAVVRRDVEEVDAAIDGVVHGVNRFSRVGFAEDIAEWRGSETDEGEGERGGAELTDGHGRSGGSGCLLHDRGRGLHAKLLVFPERLRSILDHSVNDKVAERQFFRASYSA